MHRAAAERMRMKNEGDARRGSLPRLFEDCLKLAVLYWYKKIARWIHLSDAIKSISRMSTLRRRSAQLDLEV